MQFKITGVRVKELPSKFGGTWKLAEVKIEGRGDTKFELQGYGSKFVEKVKVGDVVKGYESSKTYNGNTTPTICKITAEYVYDLLMNGANTTTTSTPDVPVEEETADDDW